MKDVRNIVEFSSLDLSKETKKMKEKYLSNPQAQKYVKSLSISEEDIDKYIVKINDLVDDLSYCKNCPGIEKCKKENPLLVTKLTYVRGIVDRELTPCKKVLEKATVEGQFPVRDFPSEWLNKSIKDIDHREPREKALLKYINYSKNNVSEWLYLTGSQNTGRSYFASVLSIDLAKKEKGPICYLNCALRFKELNDLSYKNKERFNELLDLYSTCPVLVLDDFGTEFKNDFIRDNILLQIVLKRSAKKLFTIFTSDYPIEDIVTLYSQNKAGAIQANKIGKIIKGETKGEINFGEISIY